jgi:hypothetical protein
VLELYNKIKNSSIDFQHLEVDLKIFYNALQLTGHYLRDLDLIRTACDALAIAIENLLKKYRSRNLYKRVTVAFEDIHPIRLRLTYMMTALHTSIM